MILAGIAAVALTAIGVQAQDRVDNRQVKQRARIVNGVENGSLTKKERQRLVHEQRHIRKSGRRAESDGTVTAKERVRLERMQDRAGRDIYRQKHDDQVRPRADASRE
jgi:hypothetical protein